MWPPGRHPCRAYSQLPSRKQVHQRSGGFLVYFQHSTRHTHSDWCWDILGWIAPIHQSFLLGLMSCRPLVFLLDQRSNPPGVSQGRQLLCWCLWTDRQVSSHLDSLSGVRSPCSLLCRTFLLLNWKTALRDRDLHGAFRALHVFLDNFKTMITKQQ